MLRNFSVPNSRKIRTVESLEPRLLLDAGSLLITEFMALNDTVVADGDGDFEDWIELHNSTAEAIQLEGWHLTDDAADLTQWQFPAATIAPGEYLVVFASSKYPNGPAGELHTNFKLRGQGEYLGLVRPDGQTVESDFGPTFPPQFDDVSYGWSPDFTTQGFFTHPTPRDPNVGQPVDDPTNHVVISEIMYHPSSEDRLEEYIELWNVGVRPVDLAGWQFSNGVAFTFPAVTLEPDAYLVVAADEAAFTAKYPEVTNFVAGWSSALPSSVSNRLSDSGETIELVDSAGNRVDRVRYADEGDWGVRQPGPRSSYHYGWIWTAEHDGGGKSLELINAMMSNEEGQNWAASEPDQGTPGAPNSVAVLPGDGDNIAPMILDVSHWPVIPRSGDPVTVTARLKDELSTGITVTLHSRIDVLPGEEAPDFGSTEMFDDGQSGDGEAGDGVYGAVIEAMPDRTVVEFYLEATDGTAQTRTWPAAVPPPVQPGPPANELPYLLYQVDNSFDPSVAWDPDSPPIYRLIMTETERAELAYIGSSGDRNSDAQMSGTFISIDGTGTELRYNVGIRNRGNGSRRNPPNNYRVNFVHDDPWHGVTRVDVNARWTYLQVFGSAAFRMVGIATADAEQVAARVNGVDLAWTNNRQYGSYAHLEVKDGDFVDAHFPDDNQGNLYKVNGSGELNWRGTDPGSYRNHYFKQTNEDLDDWSDLIELSDVLNNAPAETYFAEVSRVLDVDQWVRYLALYHLLGNREGGFVNGRGDDYALYRGVLDPRFVLVPHDLDTILGKGQSGVGVNINRSIFIYDGVTGLNRFLHHPEIVTRYYEAFLELIDTFYNPQTFYPLIDQIMEGWVPQAVINDMKQYVVDRTAAVLAQIPREFTASGDLPVVDGYPQTNATEVILEGSASGPYTRSVEVGGLPAEWDSRTGQWQIGFDTTQTEVIFPQGSQWSYLQDGTDQETAWREPDFTPDPPWDTGDGVFGLETASLPAPINTPLELGDPQVITYYFRKSFDYQGDPQNAILQLTTLVDDAVVVYLNGDEAFRLGFDADTPVAFDTLADDGVGNAVFEGPFSFPNDALVQGTNVIAAEVHQSSAGSGDVVFDLQLEEFHPGNVVGVPLSPGINRIPVQTFDGPDGTGNLLEETYIDVWRDTPQQQVIPGPAISVDTVLTPEQGPYRVTGDVTVDAGATLTILPGTTVFFDVGTTLTVRGRLVAEGTEYQPIRLTRVPGGGNWGGLQLRGTMEDNRIAYAVLEYGVTDDGLIGLEDSKLLLDHVTLEGTDRRRIRTVNSSLTVRNSTFTDFFAPGEPPTTEELSEHIWGSAPTATDGYFVIENNRFGTTSGNNDAIDVDGNLRPGLGTGGPVIQILDNTFLGSGDDVLELRGDALIEGNVFTNVHKDQFNGSPGDSNAITASGAGSVVYVARNVFRDVDHVAQIKNDAYLTLVNNTVVDVSVSGLYFEHPAEAGDPGRGAELDGNIFLGVPVVFAGTSPATQLTVNRSILPAEYHGYGTGNIDEDPRLADPRGDDYGLLLEEGSPALGTGPNGLDMGAMVDGGASVSGERPATTYLTDATLVVGGPAVTHYKARLSGGPWSSEFPVQTPLYLMGLDDGEYTFSLIGKDFAGVWQNEADATEAKTWTVDTSLARVRINEVLAINSSAVNHEGTFPNLIELVNDGAQPVDVAGMSITDDAGDPRKFVFPEDVPAETTIEPGGYLVLIAGVTPSNTDRTETSGPLPPAIPLSAIYLGFALDGEGESLLLYDTAARGGGLLDSVEFGVQAADLSIGRVGHDAYWALTRPTFGAANVPQRTGDPSTLKINEWFTNGEVRFNDDFVELYNPDPLPVALGGLYLTDNPVARPGLHQIAPLSYIAGSGLVTFAADGYVPLPGEEVRPNHVNFRLSADQELLGLYRVTPGDTENFTEIDQIIHYSQTTDFSEGRSPDGAETYAPFRLPTPNVSNASSTTAVAGSLALDDYWVYDDTATDRAATWREPGYDDSSWGPPGPGVLGWEDVALPAPINTQLAIPANTYYFRTHFNVDADPSDVTLEMTTLLDDGAVFYINGAEARRLGMGSGDVTYDTASNRSINTASFEGPFSLPTDALLRGDNLIAVEVHQNTSGNPDIVMGLTLTAMATTPEDPQVISGLAIFDGLRITEMMYHPAGDSGTDSEFIELQNVGDVTLNLAGVRLDRGIDFTFPPLMLQPQQFVVVVSDLQGFEARYGPGINVAGQYDGNLSNGGENVVLRLASPLRAAVLRFEYDDAWYPETDGGGFSLEIRDPPSNAPGHGPASWNDPARWQAGIIPGGTPGSADGQPLRSVLINEVLTHTDAPDTDTIELFNPTAGDIDLGGWYLSDSWKNLTKYRIPDGTSIPAGGYWVFDEADFNATLGADPNDFAIDGAHGDDVWLLEPDSGGDPVRVADHVEFGAAAAGESFGRWPNGAGALYPMVTPTLDTLQPQEGLNSGPRTGPVIISEVHYNPNMLSNDDDLEFVEIYNPTSETVALAGWRLGGGIDFDFPVLPLEEAAELEPGGVLVVVPFDLAVSGKLDAFRGAYSIDESVAIVGGYSGQLRDGGEKVQLLRPDDPPDGEPWFVPRLLEDEVIYDNEGPWPIGADGGGSSLNRVWVDAWGNAPESWAASVPTPGTVGARVVGRHVFYNFSAFDGNDPAAGALDDNAIAPDKEALLPGSTATLANYTSYIRGINGIMIDIDGLPPAAALQSDDFEFRVGNDNNPGGWALLSEMGLPEMGAKSPADITVRVGEGAGGSDRVTLIFDDNAIQKQWLQVTMLANGDTGLFEPDVFYFGNAIGETGNSTTEAKVNATDMLGARDNQRHFMNPAPVDFNFDFNRDTRVNSTDMLIARNNVTHFLNALRLISVPGGKSRESKVEGGESRVERGESGAVNSKLRTLDVLPQEERLSTGKFDWLVEFVHPDSRRPPSPAESPGSDGSGRAAIDGVFADWE